MNDDSYVAAQDRLSSLSGADAVELTGAIVDEAAKRNDAKALTFVASDVGRIRATLENDSIERNKLDYFVGNAYSVLHRIGIIAGRSDLSWEQPELRKAIFHFRRSQQFSPESGYERSLWIQNTVNLANELSHIGRPLEAIAQYDNALKLHPKFGMALGNRGFALKHLGGILHNRRHQFAALRQAWRDMSSALTMPGLTSEASQTFGAAIEDIELLIPDKKLLNTELKPAQKKRRMSRRELDYRQWCHNNRLFINDLADFLPLSLSASDPTSLPNMLTSSKCQVQYYGLYNLLKQEYVTARWLCFDGLHSDRQHFADRDVLIYNTLDLPAHAIATDQVRIGLRAAFSVLDKVGLFINEYWTLGHQSGRVWFRSVWFNKSDKAKGLLPKIQEVRNWPLRGIYWLAQDISDQELNEVLEPEARSLQKLRHKLEHQFVKVVDWVDKNQDSWSRFNADPSIVMYLTRGELASKATRILQIVRCVLLYLTMAVYLEERVRVGALGDAKIGTLIMPSLEDDEKR